MKMKFSIIIHENDRGYSKRNTQNGIECELFKMGSSLFHVRGRNSAIEADFSRIERAVLKEQNHQQR